MMSYTSALEEAEEEYPEDLILLNYEQNSIYHVNREAEGFNNLNGAWRVSEDIILNPTFRGFCTSPEIPNRTVPQIDRLVSVKLIDCGKFPWYFKKYSQQIINKMNCCQAISVTDSDTDDDCILLGDTVGKVANTININTDSSVNNVEEGSPSSQRVKKHLMMKRFETMKRREDMELQKALNQRNMNNIDFKRNKGLVGLTIIRKVSVNDLPPPDAANDKAKEVTDKTEQNSSAVYVNEADKMLSTWGTDLIEVIEDLYTHAVTQHKEANEIAKNVVSGSDIRPAADLSNSSSNMSVKDAGKAKTKKSDEDNMNNKTGRAVEKGEKHYTLKSVKKSESLVVKDSSSKLNVKKSNKNVKDNKKTNKYINDQLKKSEMNNTQCIDTQQKYETINQAKSIGNIPKSVPKDDPGPKKDIRKSTCTTEKNVKEFKSGSCSPILQCNSLLKKHKSAQENPPNRTNHDISKTASNKIATDKLLSKCEIHNIESQNIKHNGLKTNQSEDKRTKQSRIAVSNFRDDLNLHKTGQNGNIASPGQTKAVNKLHYYSLSYPEPKEKTSKDIQKTDDKQIKNPTNSFIQDFPGPTQASNNNLQEFPIHVLSVDTINNTDKVVKSNQKPTVDDTIYRLPPPPPKSDSLSQFPVDPLNDPSQNKTNLNQLHFIPISIPHKNLNLPKHYLIKNINNVKVPNYNRAAILRPKYQDNLRFGQPIQTHVSSRPLFPNFRVAAPHRGPIPQGYANTSFIYRNSHPPRELQYNNSSAYCYTNLQRLTVPVIPLATIQSSQDIYLPPINTNANLRDYNVPGNILRNKNHCNMPWAYGNHNFTGLLHPQQPPLPPPYHNLPRQTTIPLNPPQNERCLLTCDNNHLKNNDLTAPFPSNVDNEVQVKGSKSTSPVNNFKIPASIVLETLEPVETKIEMLEELDKITIEEDFEIKFKREHESAEDSHVKEIELTTTLKEDLHPIKVKSDDQQATMSKKSEIHKATTNISSEIQQAETNKKSEIKQAETNKKSKIKQAITKKQHVIQRATTYKKCETQPATTNKKGNNQPAIKNKICEINQATMNKKCEIQQATTNKKNVIQQAISITKYENQPAATNKKGEIQLATTKKKMESQPATINKMCDIQQGKTTKKSEINSTLPVKGYSPPILPIPGTLEEILKKVKAEPQHEINTTSVKATIQPHTSTEKVKNISLGDNNTRRLNATVQANTSTEKAKRISLNEKNRRLVNATIQANTSAEKAKKISLDEYKKRIGKTGADYWPTKKMRKEACEHGRNSSAKRHRNQSVDSDLGYDSDSTIIISDRFS